MVWFLYQYHVLLLLKKTDLVPEQLLALIITTMKMFNWSSFVTLKTPPETTLSLGASLIAACALGSLRNRTS
ncbi:hypothetical protein O9929_27940 [Vibrio lentus]|nr:hypothetical protein [Vibrio lentus]